MLVAIAFSHTELIFWAEVVIALFMAVIAAVLVYKFRNSTLFANVLNKTTRKSINDNLWRDAIDYENGTALKIFMKSHSAIYIGKLVAHEENGFDSWFLLTEYICMYPEGNKDFNSTTHPTPTKVMIPLNQVERVELYYGR